MRGFATRSTVEQALAWLDEHTARLPSESARLDAAAGRVLGADVVSPVDVPLFDRAMMDGYALRAAEIQGAAAANPLGLAIVGESLPGRPFAGAVAAGQAVRVMTGAPLPQDCDAVLPAEQASLEGQRLLALDQVPPGKHVGRRGEDVSAGDVVLTAGRRLRPQDVGLLSSIGVARVKLVRRPRVRIVITGNELLPAGSVPRGYQVTDANGPMLEALVGRDGGLPHNPGIVPDRPEEILAAMEDPAEVVLVSGGSSVGQEDHAAVLLARHGELAIHGIAMRPSSPTGLGRLGGRLVFLLPGNPVSCLCAYDFFAGRAIRGLAGLPRRWPYRSLPAPLASKLSSVVGRVDYARVRLVAGQVEPLATSGAAVLSSTTRADGFVVVGADSEGYPPGAMVDVLLYDP